MGEVNISGAIKLSTQEVDPRRYRGEITAVLFIHQASGGGVTTRGTRKRRSRRSFMAPPSHRVGNNRDVNTMNSRLISWRWFWSWSWLYLGSTPPNFPSFSKGLSKDPALTDARATATSPRYRWPTHIFSSHILIFVKRMLERKCLLSCESWVDGGFGEQAWSIY